MRKVIGSSPISSTKPLVKTSGFFFCYSLLFLSSGKPLAVGQVTDSSPTLSTKNAPVGATLGRPWILPKQNPTPQGENTVIFLRKIRKTTFFGGRARLAPTNFPGSRFFFEYRIPDIGPWTQSHPVHQNRLRKQAVFLVYRHFTAVKVRFSRHLPKCPLRQYDRIFREIYFPEKPMSRHRIYPNPLPKTPRSVRQKYDTTNSGVFCPIFYDTALHIKKPNHFRFGFFTI